MGNTRFEENLNDFMRKAEEYLRLNDLNAALNLARERLQEYPADAAATGIYCEALIGLGRIEEMRVSLDELAETMNGLNLIYERVGDACREKGLHREAATCYEKFISLRPETEKAREVIEKMTLLEQENILSTEHEPADQGEDAEPEFFTVTMAQLYIDQGHLQDAEAVLEKIILREPQNIEAINLLDQIRMPQYLASEDTKESLINDTVLETLTGWLKNIERLKAHAAEK